ncbi:hypothetical protein IFO70_09890 [Phormidium tenue FACHB-886]|nr:hypothetical protein [Phormidium tenue FACHB-886]
MTASHSPIRLFIGSSPKNSIEEKVLRYTLQKYTDYPIEINIIDGKAGTVKTLNTGEVKQLPHDLIDHVKGATAFSMGRWAIPEWCNYQGRAIYCDSDQLALADLSLLWNTEMHGATLAMVPVKQAKSSKHFYKQTLKSYTETDEIYYLASVMLIDCEKASAWSLASLIDLLNRQTLSLRELMYVGSQFRNRFNVSVADLPCEWNHLDYRDRTTKILHFSDLTTQPWRFHHHPISSFWEKYYLEAAETGFLTSEEILKARSERWITERIKALPALPKSVRWLVNPIWRTSSAIGCAIQDSFNAQARRVRSLPAKLSGFRSKGVSA